MHKNVTAFTTRRTRTSAPRWGIILSDLAQIGQLSLTVIQTLQPTIERAGLELRVA